MKNFIIKYKKFLIVAGLIGVIGTSFLLQPKKPIEQPVGAIPCKDDTTKGLDSRIRNCPIPANEKANFKAAEIAKLNFAKYTDSTTGITVEIKDSKINQIDGGIELYARAFKGVNQLGLGKEGKTEWERFRVFNPPILVDDSNGTIIRTWEDPITKEIKTRKLREDPLAATQSTLAHTIKVSSKDGTNIVKGSFGNTTSTFYPDAGIGGGNVTMDAQVGNISNYNPGTAWADIRSTVQASPDVNGTAATIEMTNIQSSTVASTWRGLYRGFANFDSSSIPDTDTIDTATLSFYGTAKSDDLAITPNVDIYTQNTASNNDIVSADFTTFTFTSQTGSPITYANWSTTGYNDFTFNATGRGNISKTGVSKFGTANAGYDAANSAPTWGSGLISGVTASSADVAGTTQDPKLVVVHSSEAAGGGPNPKRKLFLIDFLWDLIKFKTTLAMIISNKQEWFKS